MRSLALDLRDMARIAAPIVFINVGIQAMGVVDTLMVGKLGGAAIAAVGLGNFYFFNVAVFGVGLVFAIDPIVAQAVGAGDQEGIALGVQRGLVLAFIAALVVMLALIPGEFVLGALNQPDDVVGPTATYTRRRLFGAIPFLCFNVLRQSLQAIGPVRPVVIAVVFANLVNVFCNWVFIHGNLGAPALGVVGAGIATAVSQWVMALSVLAFAWPILREPLRHWRRQAFELVAMLRVMRIGAPIGVQWFFEGFAFGVTAIFMGWMGTTSLAAHEIALNMAALTFMVPLGVSGAAAAVVGRAIGRGDLQDARRDAYAAIAVGAGFMCITAALFIAAPEWLVGLYTHETATFAIATTLLPIAGVFQVFDGTQAVTSGVLRGTGDTTIPAVLHLVAFWGFGVPLGVYLGFYTPLREQGLWWGLVVGLGVAAVLQFIRVRIRLAGTIERVRIDRPGSNPV